MTHVIITGLKKTLADGKLWFYKHFNHIGKRCHLQLTRASLWASSATRLHLRCIWASSQMHHNVNMKNEQKPEWAGPTWDGLASHWMRDTLPCEPFFLARQRVFTKRSLAWQCSWKMREFVEASEHLKATSRSLFQLWKLPNKSSEKQCSCCVLKGGSGRKGYETSQSNFEQVLCMNLECWHKEFSKKFEAKHPFKTLHSPSRETELFRSIRNSLSTICFI